MTNEQYQQYVDMAAQYLEDMATELEMMYGYETFSMAAHGALVDLIVAHYIQVDAVRRLGGLQAIAYGTTESDAALMKKIGRLLLARAHEFSESAVIALDRAKDANRGQIENNYLEHRRLGTVDSQRALLDSTDHLANKARRWVEYSLDRFATHKVRVV